MRGLILLAGLSVVLLVVAACGSKGADEPTPAATPSPTRPVPGSDEDLSTNPKGSAGTVVPAPIESVEIWRLAAKPPNATLIVVSGLRSGCESFNDYSLAREGDTVHLQVTNRRPDLECPATYSTVTTNIPLGQPVYSNIEPCKTYTVVVNGETRSVKSSCPAIASGQFSEPTPTPTSTPVPMAGPDNLRMSGLYGRLGFTLNWQGNSDNEVGYHIERNGSEIAQLSVESLQEAKQSVLDTNTISFRDEELPNGSIFCYRVRASNEAGFSDYSNEACGTIVWPTLAKIEPVEAAPGQRCVQVTAQSGHLRIDGGYDESARPFDLYFDGDGVGSIGCYVTLCDGTFTVPSDASPGDHQVCTQGGSCLTLRVVRAVDMPTPTPFLIEITFDKLFSNPDQYAGKDIVLTGFYFDGWETTVLSERLEYTGFAEGHLWPRGRMVWIEDNLIPGEVYDQLYQQELIGPLERYGKLRINGRFEHGGRYGHVGGFTAQIVPSEVELLPWSPPQIP